MITASFQPGQSSTIAYGLYQYDYGQELCVKGLSFSGVTEVHFAKLGALGGKALIRLGTVQDGILSVDIPDDFLCTDTSFAAYIYTADTEYGETVKTVYFPVLSRATPDTGIPDDKIPLLRDLVELIRNKADNITLTDGIYLQLLAGDIPIGERLRLPNASSGANGREIELRNDGEAICWRYTDSNEWYELIKLSDLRGKDGITPELEIRNGHLFAIYND